MADEVETRDFKGIETRCLICTNEREEFVEAFFVDFLPTHITCTKANLRTLLTLSVNNNWKVKSIDIKSAFLQGCLIQRELFVKPPAGISDGKLWRLKKCLYGLNDAARGI